MATVLPTVARTTSAVGKHIYAKQFGCGRYLQPQQGGGSRKSATNATHPKPCYRTHAAIPVLVGTDGYGATANCNGNFQTGLVTDQPERLDARGRRRVSPFGAYLKR